MILYIIVLDFVTFSVGNSFQRSSYVKTMVLNEPKTCIFKVHLMKETRANSITACGKICSNTEHCRRIMFNSKIKQCALFESGENCLTDGNIEDQVCYRQTSLCSDSICSRCPIGYYGNKCENIIQDCSDDDNILVRGLMISYIQPSVYGPILEVQCNFAYGITIIHHRDTSCNEVDFNRNWNEYRNGFGYAHSEYWLGLKHIYNILQNSTFDLLVKIIQGKTRYQARWTAFNISDGDYKFSYSAFRSNGDSLGDSLTNGSYSINGRPFSTHDRDHTSYNCPERFKGGWWYLNDTICSRANPNGRRNASNFDASILFESTIHWIDNIGYQNDFNEILFLLTRK